MEWGSFREGWRRAGRMEREAEKKKARAQRSKAT